MGNIQCVKICLVGALMSSEKSVDGGSLGLLSSSQGKKKKLQFKFEPH